MNKYYLSFENDTMNIKEYNTNNGYRIIGDCTLIYNSTLVVNRLYNSIREAINDLNGYRKPILYNGENINPWQPEVFLRYNPYTGEYIQEYYFDDTILKEVEMDLLPF